MFDLALEVQVAFDSDGAAFDFEVASGAAEASAPGTVSSACYLVGAMIDCDSQQSDLGLSQDDLTLEDWMIAKRMILFDSEVLRELVAHGEEGEMVV